MRRILLLFVLLCIGTYLSAQSLTARYTVDSAVICAGQQTLHFTDQSTGNITSWNWNFGDGTTSTLQSPSHAYVSHGRYVVTLVVKDADGNVDTAWVSDKQDAIYVLSDLQVPRYYLLNPDEAFVTLKDTGFGSRFSEFPQIYEWSTGETTPSINVSTGGLYWVSWQQCGLTHRDTIRVARLNGPLSISRADSGYYGDIDVDRFEQRWKYNFPFPYGSYTNSVTKVDNAFSTTDFPDDGMLISYQSGKKELAASIRVTLAPGVVCHTNTVSEVRVPPRAPYVVHNSWNGRDTTFSKGDTLLLHDVNVGASYRWDGPAGYNDGATLKIFAAGYYSITIYKGGDTAYESIHVTEQSKLTTSFKWSRSNCDSSAISFKESFDNLANGDEVISVHYDFGNKVIDSVSSPGNFYYRFSPGMAHVVLSIQTKNGDTASYAQDIYIPNVASWSGGSTVVADTIPCTDSVRLTVYTTGPAANYVWSTGDSTRSIIVTKTGVYNCTILDTCWVNRDLVSFYARVPEKISFQVHLKPYDHDTLIAGTSPYRDAIFTWYQDGVKLPYTDLQIAPTGSGIYTAEFTNSDGCFYSSSYNYENYNHPAAVLTYTRDNCDTSKFFLKGHMENLADGDSIISEVYDFKNGDTSTLVWLFHKYPAGIYYPTYTVVTTSGHTYTATVKLVVAEYKLPTVSLALHTGAVQDTIVVTPNLHDKSFFRLKWDLLIGNNDPIRLPDTSWSIIPKVAGTYVAIAYFGTSDCRDYESIDYAGKEPAKPASLKASFTAVPSKCDSSSFHFYGTYENLTPGDSVVSFFYQFDATSGGTTQNSFNQFLRGKGTYPVTFSIRTLQGDTASQTQYLFVPEVDRTAWPVEIKVDWDSSFPCNDYKILTASTTAPKAYYLMWSTGTSGNSIEVQQSGTYNVAVYDSCSVIRGVAQVEINVLEPFNPSITYIPGNPDTLMAPVPPANISYSWMKDNIELKDTGNYILPVGSGTYRVYAMNERGCYPNNASFQYIDSIHHAASLTYEMSPCDSATFYISGNVENLSAGETIVSKTFDFGDGTTATEDGWHTFTTKGNFEMTFTAVTSSGNSYTTVKAYYNYRLPVSVSLSLHRGTQDTIFATPDYRDASFFTLEWSKDSVIMPDKGWFIIPSGAGKYEVYVKPRYGCTYSKYLDYTPAPAPAEAEAEVTAPAANASQLELSADFGNTTFNADNEFTIQLQVKDPNGRTIYATEAVNLGTIKGTDPANLSVAIPATLACASNYTVRVISSSPADTTKWSNTFAITNQPAQPVITQVGDSLFTSSIYDLQWYKDDVAIAGATNTAIRARANGAYKVAALNGEGCSSISAARAVVITAVSNVSFGSNTVSAFPNPSEGPVYLKFGYPLTQQVAVKVYNAQGNVVYTINTIRQQQLLELSALPKGFYVVEVAGYGTRKVLTIILQ